MPEDKTTQTEGQTSPPASIPKKSSMFADILGRVAGSFVSQENKEPEVKASVLEAWAKRMASLGYEWTEETLKILLLYLKGYNLWLVGNVGVGKTYFFDCLNKIRRARGGDPIIKLSMIETQGWTMEQAAEWARDYADYDVVIDDLGAEPLLNHYGEKIEVFPYLLEKRMNRTRRRTHMTSNLSAKDILKRYDRRVADRIAQMFKGFEIKARQSRRRNAPWIKAEGATS
jgi:DNA replication protein DnaC